MDLTITTAKLFEEKKVEIFKINVSYKHY